MKGILGSMMALAMLAGTTAWAQQSELTELKAELRRQQEVIAGLIKKVEELETKQSNTVSRADLEQETKTQEEAVQSLGESISNRVNLAGYYNFRYFNEDSPAVGAFQQHHLALILSKQLRRWNFLMELELQNEPHHREGGEEGEESEGSTDISGEGIISVENAWMEYNQSRFLNLRVGKQLSPQYWWQHRYPNLTYSTTRPIFLRELFPPELTGAMIHGSAGKAVGASELAVGYKLYVANNEVPNSDRQDLRDGKAWGGKLELRLPVAGRLKRLDFAADLYNGKLFTHDVLATDTVWGFESQLEVDRFLLNTEYARGNSLGQRRFGYYVQPAVRVHERWLAFYRVERLDSPRIERDETRHLAGINFRPFAQIALKLEFYRALPRHLEGNNENSESRNKATNGVATSAVFFF